MSKSVRDFHWEPGDARLDKNAESICSEQHRRIATAMGFSFDAGLPVNCLHPECWTEQLHKSAEDFGSETGWY